jgi:phosphoribosylanthranilate isomerase
VAAVKARFRFARIKAIKAATADDVANRAYWGIADMILFDASTCRQPSRRPWSAFDWRSAASVRSFALSAVSILTMSGTRCRHGASMVDVSSGVDGPSEKAPRPCAASSGRKACAPA